MFRNTKIDCWWNTTLILLLASLKNDEALLFSLLDLIDCHFLETFRDLLQLKKQCVLSSKQLLEDFMAEYVTVDPFINPSDPPNVRIQKQREADNSERLIKESFRTQYQFGELAFNYLINCPFFKYLVLETRSVIRRTNCEFGCPDPDGMDDPYKYDVPETITGTEKHAAYPVPMPNKAEGETLEAKFISLFNANEVDEKLCPTHNGVKRQTNSTEISNLPHAIILSLQRGFHEDNVLKKKSQAVLLDKQFQLKTFDNSTADYKMVACGRHSGSCQSGHWLANVLTKETDQDGSDVWVTVNDTWPITKADSYDLRLSTLFLYKKVP